MRSRGKPWRAPLARWAAAGLAALLLAAAGWLSWRGQRALNDVDTMLVPTVALPTPTRPPTAPPVADAERPVAPTSAPPIAPAPTAAPALEQPLTLLLLGADTRPGDTASRTDAMVVVYVDPRAERVALLSLPRDLWVAIPGHGQARVNAAYPIGELRIGAGYGPALAKQTVGDLLSIPIDRFALLDLNGFRALIDALGGITVDVPRALDDPAYPTDDYGVVAVHFDAGPQTMDGERALIYARTRHADNDFGRGERQQRVLMAIFARVREQGVLGNLANLDSYTAALRDSLRTDLSREELIRLAALAARLRAGSVERYAIGPRDLVALRAPATFAADPQALRQRVAALIGAQMASR